MTDIDMAWGSDLSFDDTGDIATVSGLDEMNQRIVRRFLTNSTPTDANGNAIGVGDYIWEPAYGGNARVYVDQTATPALKSAIQKSFLSQIQQEAEIVQSPPPVVTVVNSPEGLTVQAQVTLVSGQLLNLPQIELSS